MVRTADNTADKLLTLTFPKNKQALKCYILKGFR